MKRRPGVILIVDDDFDLRESLRQFLELENFEVRLASNGAEALMQLQSIEYPALILLDLMMPEMDGFQFLEKIKTQSELVRKIPIIVMTALNQQDKKDDRLELAVQVVGKPFDIEKLLALITRHMRPDSTAVTVP